MSLFFLFLLGWWHDAVQKSLRLCCFISDSGRIVLQVNIHPLTESDFWFAVILSRRRPWDLHDLLTTHCPLPAECMWGYWLSMCYSSWSIVHLYLSMYWVVAAAVLFSWPTDRACHIRVGVNILKTSVEKSCHTSASVRALKEVVAIIATVQFILQQLTATYTPAAV